MRIVELRDRMAVTRLKSEWCALQAQCPNATPFQTWEWNEAWWRTFGSHKRACLLLFYLPGAADPDRLIGIAPLYISRHLATPLRRLAWIGTGSSDYLGPLAAPEWSDAVESELLRFIEHDLTGWDMADLQQIPASCSLGCVKTTASPGRPASDATGHRAVFAMDRCPYLDLPPSFDVLTARLGKKMRSNIGYYDRLIQRELTDVRSYVADARSVARGVSALFELHQKRWNARWLPGALGPKRVQRFHREVAARFLANGWLRLHLMEAGGEIRAALYCFALNGRTYYYLGGFAPELARYSLGTVQTAHAIRQAISEGCSEFDFLRGDESYKFRWLPEERVNHRLLLLRRRRKLGGLGELPGRAGLALNRVERYVTRRAKAIAGKHAGNIRAEAPVQAVQAVVRQRTKSTEQTGSR